MIKNFLCVLFAFSILIISNCTLTESNSSNSAKNGPVSGDDSFNLNVSISPEGAGSINPSGGSFKKDTQIELTAACNPGYSFDHWEGVDSSTITQNSYKASVLMNKERTVIACFIEVPTFTLSVNITQGGSVSINPDQVKYNSGTEVVLTPIAGLGYTFDRWEGVDNVLADNKASVKMNSNKIVSLYFKTVPVYTLTTSVIMGSGTIEVIPNQTQFSAGTAISLTAVPAQGYRFVRWGNGVNSTCNPVTITMDNNKTIIAMFEKIQTAKWTIIAHFACDNDLDFQSGSYFNSYIRTLQDIKGADLNNNIEIVLLIDGYDTLNPFPYKDGYYHISGQGAGAQTWLVKEFKEINSGNPKDIEDFMDWAVQNYPAEHYLYAMLDHGDSFTVYNPLKSNIQKAIGIDYSNGDILDVYELREAAMHLKQLIGKKIDVFYCFACLMSTVEVAYEMKDSADYMIASEDLFPITVWCFQGLNNINLNPDISSLDLGKSICDSAYNCMSTYNPSPCFILALIDLSKMNGLYDAIDVYAGLAVNDINANSNAYYYNAAGENSGLEWEGSGYYSKDFGRYLDNIASYNQISSNVRNQALIVKQKLSDSLVYCRYNEFQNLQGISIFIPVWSASFIHSIDSYKSSLLFGSNKWVDYAELMWELKP